MTLAGRPAAALTALLAAVLLAAGCGGSGKKDPAAEFKQDYPAASAKLKTVGDDLGTAIQEATKRTNAQLAQAFTVLASRVRGSSTQLKAIDAPAKAKADLRTLTASLDRVAHDLDQIVIGADADDPATAQTATRSLLAHAGAVKTARDKLDAYAKTLKKG